MIMWTTNYLINYQYSEAIKIQKQESMADINGQPEMLIILGCRLDIFQLSINI